MATRRDSPARPRLRDMFALYVHRIDPVIAGIAGVYIWWYGLSYTLGFVQVHLFVTRNRGHLGLTRAQAATLALWFAVGVLAGGRAIQVAFDEWPFYREHLGLIPALWLGGMATHGLLFGAALATLLAARVHGLSFRRLADALVIPGALLMGLGRIGNFIDGQIVGHVTDVPWAVVFPDAEGARHPVVLYDGLKNLLLVPYLLWVRRTNPTPGAVAARFVFWYAGPRILVDLFRDYPTHRLALGTGQTLNILMTLLGTALLVRSRLRRLGRLPPVPGDEFPTLPLPDAAPAAWQRVTFVAVLLFCLTIPSNWTQDVPARYGSRHAGLRHSVLYPPLSSAPVAPRTRQAPVAPRPGG